MTTLTLAAGPRPDPEQPVRHVSRVELAEVVLRTSRPVVRDPGGPGS